MLNDCQAKHGPHATLMRIPNAEVLADVLAVIRYGVQSRPLILEYTVI